MKQGFLKLVIRESCLAAATAPLQMSTFRVCLGAGGNRRLLHRWLVGDDMESFERAADNTGILQTSVHPKSDIYGAFATVSVAESWVYLATALEAAVSDRSFDSSARDEAISFYQSEMVGLLPDCRSSAVHRVLSASDAIPSTEAE